MKRNATMWTLLGLVCLTTATLDAAEVPLNGLQVGGVRLVNFEDQKNGIRPFNWSVGYTLSLVGTLPEAAMSIQPGEMDKALADTGQNLLSEKKWDRRVSFPRLSKDRKKVAFEVTMKVPAEPAKGLKELSGTLTYLTAQGTKEADLGTIALKKGAKGDALNAEVISVGPSKWQKGKQELQLKLGINKDAIKEIQVIGTDGKPMPVKRSGSMYSNDWVQLGLTHDKAFPASARVKLVLHDNLKKQVVRFTLRDVTLTGRPLKK